ALAAFQQPGKQAHFPVLSGALAGPQLLLHNLEAASVNDGLVLPFDHNPILRFLFPDGADFEAILLLLGSNRASINGVGQDVLNNREVPDIPPLFGVLLLPFGKGIAQAPLAIPPGGTGHLLLLQSAPDEV